MRGGHIILTCGTVLLADHQVGQKVLVQHFRCLVVSDGLLDELTEELLLGACDAYLTSI